jgi:hypothetical protein
LKKRAADDAVGLQSARGIAAYELVQVLPDAHPDAKTVGRSGRDNDLKNLTGVEPGQPDLAADLQPCDLAERGVQLELSGEKKPPVSDEEQPARKQQDASYDEGTNDDPHSTHD